MSEIGVGIVGTGFMARVHAQALAAAERTWSLPVHPRVRAYCGRPDSPVSSLPSWPELADAQPLEGWRALLEDPAIDLCYVCTPNASHAEICVRALEAGKHVFCEKPLAHRLTDSSRMAARAAAAPALQAAVGFNYRRVPAIDLARAMIAAGDIGAPRHICGGYLQDWGLDRSALGIWRADPAQAGYGALSDIGSHLIDLAQHLMGSTIVAVAGTGAVGSTLAAPGGSGDRSECTSAYGGAAPVAYDDAALLVRFDNGASGSLDISRLASGHRNGLHFEVRGCEGSIAFSLERMNELELSVTRARGETWRRFYVTERDHPWQGRWPPGHPLSWEHTFANQALDLLTAIATDDTFHPTFADGAQVDGVIEAAARAIESGGWQAAARGQALINNRQTV
jgi:predicted dehydrogenase